MKSDNWTWLALLALLATLGFMLISEGCHGKC